MSKGHTITDDNRSLTFRQPISLADFSKALKWFNAMWQVFSGHEAKYTDFTDWLIANDFVEVGPSEAEVNKIMETAK